MMRDYDQITDEMCDEFVDIITVIGAALVWGQYRAMLLRTYDRRRSNSESPESEWHRKYGHTSYYLRELWRW